MKWFLVYLAIGFVVALISYHFQRRNRNVRKVKKIGGVFAVVMFYTWLWPFGLAFDLKELVSNKMKRRNIKTPKKRGVIPIRDIKRVVRSAPPSRKRGKKRRR